MKKIRVGKTGWEDGVESKKDGEGRQRMDVENISEHIFMMVAFTKLNLIKFLNYFSQCMITLSLAGRVRGAF